LGGGLRKMIGQKRAKREKGGRVYWGLKKRRDSGLEEKKKLSWGGHEDKLGSKSGSLRQWSRGTVSGISARESWEREK